MIAKCGKCQYRSANLGFEIKGKLTRCLFWPGDPIRKEKDFDKCGQFIEGDPKFMDDAEYKAWTSYFGGNLSDQAAVLIDVINDGSKTVTVNNTVNAAPETTSKPLVKGKGKA